MHKVNLKKGNKKWENKEPKKLFIIYILGILISYKLKYSITGLERF